MAADPSQWPVDFYELSSILHIKPRMPSCIKGARYQAFHCIYLLLPQERWFEKDADLARNVRFVPDGSNPTGAIRRGFYERPSGFGGSLPPSEADPQVLTAAAGLHRLSTFVTQDTL